MDCELRWSREFSTFNALDSPESSGNDIVVLHACICTFLEPIVCTSTLPHKPVVPPTLPTLHPTPSQPHTVPVCAKLSPLLAVLSVAVSSKACVGTAGYSRHGHPAGGAGRDVLAPLLLLKSFCS